MNNNKDKLVSNYISKINHYCYDDLSVKLKERKIIVDFYKNCLDPSQNIEDFRKKIKPNLFDKNLYNILLNLKIGCFQEFNLLSKKTIEREEAVFIKQTNRVVKSLEADVEKEELKLRRKLSTGSVGSGYDTEELNEEQEQEHGKYLECKESENRKRSNSSSTFDQKRGKPSSDTKPILNKKLQENHSANSFK